MNVAECYQKIQYLLTIMAFLPNVVNSRQIEEAVDRALKNMRTLKLGENGYHLYGRQQIVGRLEGRLTNIPAGHLFAENKSKPLKCGSSHDVGSLRAIFWRMKSPYEMCYHEFLGSKTDNCTVSILCGSSIHFEGKLGGECQTEYLKLSDGTSGYMVGCGSFQFSNKPRYPRNGGTDLYVYFKGSSISSCVAICKEDLKPFHNVDTPRILAEKRNFQGLQMEPACTCGIRNTAINGRIVGGNNAQFNEFPWQVAIVYKGYRGYERIPFCGGSLINDRHIITAGHCFSPEEIAPWEIEIVLHAHVMDRRIKKGTTAANKLYFGIPGWNLPAQTDESEQSIRADVEEILVHPLFTSDIFDWDIAILKLKDRINLKNSKVRPICLPYIDEAIKYNEGSIHVVTGWGRIKEKAVAGSRILQKLDVPFAERNKCLRYTFPTKRHICAGYLSGKADACTGDSGGPLVYKIKPETNQYLLSGIVSAGEGCARRYRYGIYTNTLELAQWIYHHTPDAIWCDR